MNENEEKNVSPENNRYSKWSLQVPIRLKDENELLNRVLEDEQMSVVIWTSEKRIIWINRYAAQMTGSASNSDVVTLDSIIPEKVISRIIKKVNLPPLHGFQYRYGGPAVTRDGKEVYITWHNYMIRDERGENYILSVGIDVTNLNHSEKQLEIATKDLTLAKQEVSVKKEELNASNQKLIDKGKMLEKSLNELHKREKALWVSEERSRLMVEGASDGLWDWDIINDTVFISERWKKFLGLQQKKITGHYKKWINRIHPDDVDHVLDNLNSHLKKETPYYLCEYRLKDKSGNYIWILSRGKALWDGNGKAVRMAGSHTDITNYKVMEDKLRHLAYFDTLTDVPLRSVFLDKLKAAIEQAEKDKQKLAVLFLDVDNFKSINDTFGHNIGDKVLKKIACKLKTCIRSSDVLARMGGDEFVILVSNLSDMNYVNEIADRIIKNLEEPFFIKSHTLYVTISIGISIFPSHGRNANTLLKKADIAMYRAKEKGKNNFQYFSEVMAKEAATRDIIKRDLRIGIENAEFFLCYQPICLVKSDKIRCLEALLRWRHPQKGIVKPRSFIPALERTGLIIPLGEWVFHTVCRQLNLWQKKIDTGLCVSVNVSRIQLQQPNFAEKVMKILDQEGVPPDRLEIEITEAAFADSIQTVITNLSSLSKQGIKIDIDDFGTGFSSLAYVQKLMISSLKIDQSLIRNMKSFTSRAIIESIISLGHKLNISITAKGTETKKEYLELKTMNCDCIQGNYIKPPLSPDEFEGTYTEGTVENSTD